MKSVTRATALALLLVIGTVPLLGSCATKAQTGAIIGAAGGAAVGVIGKMAGSGRRGDPRRYGGRIVAG
jgi:hypothetical protein